MNALFKLAVVAGIKSAVAFHVKRGHDVNAADKKGVMPLGLAASLGHGEICDLLIESGADPHLVDGNGKSASDYASVAGHRELARRLSLGRCDADVVEISDEVPNDRLPELVETSSVQQSAVVCDASSEIEGRGPRADAAPPPGSMASRLADSDRELLKAIAHLADSSKSTSPAVSSLDSGASIRPILQSEELSEPGQLRAVSPVEIRKITPDHDLTVEADPVTSERGDAFPDTPAMMIEVSDGFSSRDRHPVVEQLVGSGDVGGGGSSTDGPKEAAEADLRLTAAGEDTLLWEAEPAVTLLSHDDEAYAEAEILHHALSVPVKNDQAVWSEVKVNLPSKLTVSQHLPNSLDELIRWGLSLGWITGTQLEHAVSQAKLTPLQSIRFSRIVSEIGLTVDESFYGSFAPDLLSSFDDAPSLASFDEDTQGAIEEFLEPFVDLATATVLKSKEFRAGSGGSDEILWKTFSQDRRRLIRELLSVEPALDIFTELVRAKGNDSSLILDDLEQEDEEEGDASSPPEDDHQGQLGHYAVLAGVSRERDAGSDLHSHIETIANLQLPLASLCASVLTRLTTYHASLDVSRLAGALKTYERTRENILKNNLALVLFFAKRFRRSGIPLMDLAQEGSIGLMRAAERFDTAKGKFGPYAAMWIRQSISRAISDTSKTIRIPVHVQDALRRVSRRRSELSNELGKSLTAIELSEGTGFTLTKLAALEAISPLAQYGRDNVRGLSRVKLEQQTDEAPSPEERLAEKQLRTLVNNELAQLDPRQMQILKLRFGLDGEREHTLEEVGEIYGVTRERIRQIEAKALTRLAHPAISGPLKSAYRAHFRSGTGR